MSNIRLIYLIEPISHLIPYVQKPKRNIKTNEKLVWTGIVLFIYLTYSQIPLYGIYKTQDADPLHYMRVIFYQKLILMKFKICNKNLFLY